MRVPVRHQSYPPPINNVTTPSLPNRTGLVAGLRQPVTFQYVLYLLRPGMTIGHRRAVGRKPSLGQRLAADARVPVGQQLADLRAVLGGESRDAVDVGNVHGAPDVGSVQRSSGKAVARHRRPLLALAVGATGPPVLPPEHWRSHAPAKPGGPGHAIQIRQGGHVSLSPGTGRRLHQPEGQLRKLSTTNRLGKNPTSDFSNRGSGSL